MHLINTHLLQWLLLEYIVSYHVAAEASAK